LPPAFNFGLLASFISTPGYPTTSILIILSFSTVISTGPIGGAPLPLIRVAPLMINCEKGPSEELPYGFLCTNKKETVEDDELK
jgi:hypothetical protein